jgi:uncharacterized protein YbaP (TraB family)
LFERSDTVLFEIKLIKKNRMRNIQWFKFLVLSSMLFVVASCSKSTTKAISGEPKLEDALLWEITGPGFAKPSFLYGTIHLIGGNDYFLPKGTLGAIDNSEAMFFEIDMKEMTDMGAMVGLMDKLFMKDDLTLKDLLKEEEYKLVTDFFADKGLPLFFLERIKPLFLSAMTYGDFSPESFSTGEMKSYEIEFNKLAENKKMKTGGLETVEFQIGVFDQIPYEAQAKMLVETIQSAGAGKDEMEVMTKMYKEQKISQMATSALGEDEGGLQDYESILLSNRNKAWIPQILVQSKKQPTFYAVGAGHLGGKMGVINLLREAGLTLKPLSKL